MREFCQSLKKWKFGLCYLICIPVFAFIYCLIPNGFYQSTVAQEGVIWNVEDKMSDWMFDTLQKRLIVSGLPSQRFSPSGCLMTKDLPSTRKLQNVSPYLEYSPNGKHVYRAWASISIFEMCSNNYGSQVMLSANFDVIRGFSRVLTLLEFIPSSDRSSLSSGPDNYEIAKISERNCSEISLYFGGINFDSGICGIELSGIETNSIERMLREYNLSLQGFVQGDKLFLRMFYLSAVTITTLGYGDIVPVTHLARGFVAMQSILGVILIGLFLNSIVRSKE